MRAKVLEKSGRNVGEIWSHQFSLIYHRTFAIPKMLTSWPETFFPMSKICDKVFMQLVFSRKHQNQLFCLT